MIKMYYDPILGCQYAWIDINYTVKSSKYIY